MANYLVSGISKSNTSPIIYRLFSSYSIYSGSTIHFFLKPKSHKLPPVSIYSFQSLQHRGNKQLDSKPRNLKMVEDGASRRFEPIAHPTSVSWSLPITHADYNKLLKGFEPQDMEDRWLCVTDKPDTKENTVLYLCRSWTGLEQLSLDIAAANPDDTEANSLAKIKKLSWEKETYETEDEAKASAVRMCKNLLGCDIENAPLVD